MLRVGGVPLDNLTFSFSVEADDDGIGLQFFQPISVKRLFPIWTENRLSLILGKRWHVVRRWESLFVPVAQCRLALSVLGLINQEATLIKKETAHQLPAQAILQKETIELATCCPATSNAS